MDNQAMALEAHHHDGDTTDVFGFWLYIMTDCILFCCLFATFLVLNQPSIYTPALKQYIDLPYVLGETFVLLASNFTFCLASLNLYHDKIRKVQGWLLITFVLGATFVAMEVYEFAKLAREGFAWDISGQASGFFTLVGTHGFHVSVGLLWILLLTIQFSTFKDLKSMKRRMTMLGLFWNFLDIVWIFLFTIVYIMGAL